MNNSLYRLRRWRTLSGRCLGEGNEDRVDRLDTVIEGAGVTRLSWEAMIFCEADANVVGSTHSTSGREGLAG